MVMEPAGFLSNPQTQETNTYQAENPADLTNVQNAARREFRALRDQLVEKGVIVTTTLGRAACPDDVFCNNWVSTHAGKTGRRQMILYPMLADNRRTERRPELLDMLRQSYDVLLDLAAHENQGRFLESTGSLAMDRVNGRIYSALSARTDKALAEQAARALGYEIVFFDTRNHVGKPVYHTDVMMFIGTGYAGICADCIVPEQRRAVIDTLANTHEIVLLSMDQMRSFCGNALEVRGTGDQPFLVMSQQAHNALQADQKKILLTHVKEILSSDLKTIETYGGGSARCMLLELH